MKKMNLLCLVVLTVVCFGCSKKGSVITGELKKWHKITLTFDGPETSESANPNPFLYYNLTVTFKNGNSSYKVPGYYAADGNAANTSADSGNKWRVHFSPDAEGSWTYHVSFRKGENVAVSSESQKSESAEYMDGTSGSFHIGPSDKTAPDLRAKGRLKYVSKNYLQFAETGEYFLKVGADAPENLFAYEDFDGDFKTDGHKDQFIKNWEPHLKDWQLGDPTWQNGKGKGLIGAINYLSSKGMNVFSFLTLNIEGDDQNVFPYTNYDERLRIDVSKMDQWEIVLNHGNNMGMYLHFKTSEVENQLLLDGGEVGIERKLYYRELISRFAHHLALNWNIGEENGTWGKNERKGQTTEQRLAMAQFFSEFDPYHHHVVIHNGQPFDDLLVPDVKYTGLSVQTNKPDFSNVHGVVLNWLEKSSQAGLNWVVAVDEPGDATHSLITDEEDPNHDNARKNALWGTLMAGGAGVEWYFGYKHPHSDLTCQDWRSRDKMWDQCKIALDFFKENQIPFWEMTNADGLSSNQDSYCFIKENEVYLVYLKNGGSTDLDLSKTEESFQLLWFNPRTGKFVGSAISINGGQKVNVGPPPLDKNNDWAVLIRKN
jgi:hypothetical protein